MCVLHHWLQSTDRTRLGIMFQIRFCDTGVFSGSRVDRSYFPHLEHCKLTNSKSMFKSIVVNICQ